MLRPAIHSELFSNIPLAASLSFFVLCELDPFLPPGRQMESKSVKHTCVECDKPALRRCSKCHVAWYCSRDCQRVDWATIHKHVCCVTPPSKMTLMATATYYRVRSLNSPDLVDARIALIQLVHFYDCKEYVDIRWVACANKDLVLLRCFLRWMRAYNLTDDPSYFGRGTYSPYALCHWNPEYVQLLTRYRIPCHASACDVFESGGSVSDYRYISLDRMYTDRTHAATLSRIAAIVQRGEKARLADHCDALVRFGCDPLGEDWDWHAFITGRCDAEAILKYRSQDIMGISFMDVNELECKRKSFVELLGAFYSGVCLGMSTRAAVAASVLYEHGMPLELINEITSFERVELFEEIINKPGFPVAYSPLARH